MDEPLVLVRAVHFVATVLVSGTVFFLVFVAEPAFDKAEGDCRVAAILRRWLARTIWIGLALLLVSGAGWLLFAAAQMMDEPPSDALSDGTVLTVLTGTEFGYDWIGRLVLAGVLALSIPTFCRLERSELGWGKLWVVLLGAGVAGTLAFAGHGAAGTGLAGVVHLTADALHLVAAAAWAGALVPLALLLGAASGDNAAVPIAREAVFRFSTLGIASVSTILVTGIINTWMLVGTLAALVNTDYGRLLLAKIALFLIMVAMAGTNRMLLTPRLTRASAFGASPVLHQLRHNSLIEAALAGVILLLVAMLGTLAPTE